MCLQIYLHCCACNAVQDGDLLLLLLLPLTQDPTCMCIPLPVLPLVMAFCCPLHKPTGHAILISAGHLSCACHKCALVARFESQVQFENTVWFICACISAFLLLLPLRLLLLLPGFTYPVVGTFCCLCCRLTATTTPWVGGAIWRKGELMTAHMQHQCLLENPPSGCWRRLD